MKLSVAVAGTTSRTVTCIQALLTHQDFFIPWILTPDDKPVGRKQIITPSPVAEFAEKNSIPVTKVTKSLTPLRQEIEKLPQPDLLLVVDFGYLIPSWLLELPKIGPVNIHPSALPRWRGSSPGQFVILYGEKMSAVSVIEMTKDFDEGAIIASIPFDVASSWNAEKYYAHAFSTIAAQLPSILLEYAKNPEIAKPQPKDSPTPIARKISKEDSFIPWEVLTALMLPLSEQPSRDELESNLPPIIAQACALSENTLQGICNAVRAFSPWPQVWTTIPTSKGTLRMKILSCSQQDQSLKLDVVHIEGKTPSVWKESKTILKK